MIESLIGIGRCNRMEMDVEKTNVMRNPRQPSTIQFMVGKKQQENVKYFNYEVSVIAYDARCTRKIKSRTVIKKAAFRQEEESVHQKIGHKFKEGTCRVLHLKYSILWS
jgi:hypothetical protein